MTGGHGDLLHDAAAPLLVITGFADALAREGAIPEEVRRDYAARIMRAAEELRGLLASASAPG